MNSKILEALIKHQPNTLIFVEKKYSDVDDVIFSYLKSINCSQEHFCNKCLECNKINDLAYYDLKIIDGFNENIYKNDVEKVIGSFNYSALEKSGNKFLIIYGIENANKFIINSLLKVIENLQKNTFFIFTTRNLQQVPQTVISRCQVYNILEDKKKIIDCLVEKNIPKNHIDGLMEMFFNLKEMLKNYDNQVFLKLFDLGNIILESKNNFVNLKKILNDFKKLSYFEIIFLIKYVFSKYEVFNKSDVLDLVNLVKLSINKILIFDRLISMLN